MLLVSWSQFLVAFEWCILLCKMACEKSKNNISLEESSDDDSIFITQTAKIDESPLVSVLDEAMDDLDVDGLCFNITASCTLT